MGYVARIMGGIIREGKDPYLPEWQDLGGMFQEGLKIFGAYLVYSLPVTLLVVIGYLTFVLPMIAIDTAVLPEGMEIALILGGYLVGFGLIGIGALLGFAFSLFAPLAVCHLVKEDRFGAAFQVSRWWQVLKANWSGFLLAYLILVGGGMLAYYASQILVFTLILCCLYPFVLAGLGAYLGIVGSALFAQAYQRGSQRMA